MFFPLFEGRLPAISLSFLPLLYFPFLFPPHILPSIHPSFLCHRVCEWHSSLLYTSIWLTMISHGSPIVQRHSMPWSTGLNRKQAPCTANLTLRRTSNVVNQFGGGLGWRGWWVEWVGLGCLVSNVKCKLKSLDPHPPWMSHC